MIRLVGQVENIATRRDRTVKLTIGTNELNPVNAAEIFALAQQFVYIGIKAESFTKEEESDIDALKTEMKGVKTPSQRLRGVLFHLFNKDDEGYKAFDEFYQSKMETIIEHFKTKLD